MKLIKANHIIYYFFRDVKTSNVEDSVSETVDTSVILSVYHSIENKVDRIVFTAVANSMAEFSRDLIMDIKS